MGNKYMKILFFSYTRLYNMHPLHTNMDNNNFFMDYFAGTDVDVINKNLC
jgi:hypothetical protein